LSYLTDALGSVIRLNNEAGAKVVDYTYEPYGKTTADAMNDNPIQYTGRENDGATGFYYYRARYYSPLYQRFISEDPIGLMGGINKYAYVEGDPVFFSDPMGLWRIAGKPEGSGRGPQHGNYCGEGYTGGQGTFGGTSKGNAPPEDSMDECCKAHDACYDQCGNNTGTNKRVCDDKLVECLSKLPNNPRDWDRPPIGSPFEANTYRGWAKTFFGRPVPDWNAE
jgi:RHS repeat-associated protein